MYLLDSDVVINHLLGRASVSGLLDELVDEGPLYTSALTRFEVLQGMRPAETFKTFHLLNLLETVDVDLAVADKAASFYQRYHKERPGIGGIDFMIAATALVHDLTLVTLNLKDYPQPEIRVYGRS